MVSKGLASNKADLSHILQESVVHSNAPLNHSEICTIFDGMAALQTVENQAGARTFGEGSDLFLKYVALHVSGRCKNVEVVFDRYRENSVKDGTRAKIKHGIKNASREAWIVDWQVGQI